MKEDDVLDIIMQGGGMAQYTDPTHEHFDVYTSILLAGMRPDLFTDKQVSKLMNLKELDSSFTKK